MKKTWKKLIFTALFSALLLENPALPLEEAVSLTAEAATPALSRSAFRLTRGKTRILRLKNASGTVRWTSSNNAVATVTSKGVVKGIKAGSAFIKAYYKGKTYKCAVVVEAPKLSASTLTLETGTYSQLTLKNTKQSIVWKSSNSSVASVSSSGYVAAQKSRYRKNLGRFRRCHLYLHHHGQKGLLHAFPDRCQDKLPEGRKLHQNQRRHKRRRRSLYPAERQ